MDFEALINSGFSDKALYHFNPYVVKLGLLDASKDVTEVLSGFLLTIKQRTYWISSGHVIQAAKKAPRSLICRWVETEPLFGQTIPVELTDVLSRTRFVNQSGVDLSVTRMREYEVTALLKKGSAKSFDAEAIVKPRGWKPSGMFIFGCPAEKTTMTVISQSPRRRARINTQTGLLPAIPAPRSRTDREGFWRPGNALFAELFRFDELVGGPASIAGMSGGPWLGFNQAANPQDWVLLGVQSSWLDKSHFVRATPLRRHLPQVLGLFHDF